MNRPQVGMVSADEIEGQLDQMAVCALDIQPLTKQNRADRLWQILEAAGCDPQGTMRDALEAALAGYACEPSYELTDAGREALGGGK